MAFGIALSGIAAAQTDLDVTANNISNSETVGFKESRTEFAELFSTSLQGVSSLQAGNGVRVASVAQQFGQGNIQTSSNSLDLAINGSGFFVVSDNGALQYTRAGSFASDSAGYVVNSAGQRVQVYPPAGNGSFNTSTLSDLQLSTSQSAPSATRSPAACVRLHRRGRGEEREGGQDRDDGDLDRHDRRQVAVGDEHHRASANFEVDDAEELG